MKIIKKVYDMISDNIRVRGLANNIGISTWWVHLFFHEMLHIIKLCKIGVKRQKACAKSTDSENISEESNRFYTELCELGWNQNETIQSKNMKTLPSLKRQ